MIAKLDRNRVSQAIARLPENFREVIVLREIEELSYHDIAADRRGADRNGDVAIGARPRAPEDCCSPATRKDGKMNCEEAQELLEAFHDEELTAETRSAVAAHVKTCADCSAALAQLGDLSAAIKAVGAFPVPESLRRNVQKLAADAGRANASAPRRWGFGYAGGKSHRRRAGGRAGGLRASRRQLRRALSTRRKPCRRMCAR